MATQILPSVDNQHRKDFGPTVSPERLLLGPGPSNADPAVLKALSQPPIGHLDPFYVDLMSEVQELLRYVWQTSNRLTLPMSGTGSAAMEATLANVVEPGDKVLVAIKGYFGHRLQDMAGRYKANVETIHKNWGNAFSLEEIEDALKKHNPAVLAIVHAETSTGVRSDAEQLCQLAKSAGMLTIVDAVTSLAGIDLQVDAWGADVVYSGTQKCLSSLPGIAPITFSPDAVAAITSRTHKVQSWFLDMNLIMGYWGEGAKRAYHHTAPVNAIYALHESLLMLEEEGRQESFARHSRNHAALAAGLADLGLELAVAEAWRLPQLNAVSIPDGKDDVDTRARLLADFDLEVGAGLGELAGKQWRIGLMGSSSHTVNINRCLSAFEVVLAS
mgnify:CR=1 FL=1